MSKQTQDAYIVAVARTPSARHEVRSRTFAQMICSFMFCRPSCNSARGRSGSVDDVIAGCAMPEAEQGINVARVALLLAGLPDNVPGMTINRFCASGLQAVALAADRIRLGEADVIIAAGTESMSMIPMMGNKVAMNPAMFIKDENVAIAYGMEFRREGRTTMESRCEQQDEFAMTSHHRALKAIETGEFQQEIAPILLKNARI